MAQTHCMEPGLGPGQGTSNTIENNGSMSLSLSPCSVYST